ncbi:MAG: MAPEG family protein [Alphaproteobacteria bacterium]
MPQESIFAPVGALALLTFIVLGLIPFRRFRAAGAGQVTTSDFELGESRRVPPHVALANRAYMNLLEVPVLFYVASLMYFVAGRVDQTVLAVAWTYVALRAVHSLIHVTYNNVIHRLAAFATSNVVLMAYWALFFI